MDYQFECVNQSSFGRAKPLACVDIDDKIGESTVMAGDIIDNINRYAVYPFAYNTGGIDIAVTISDNEAYFASQYQRYNWINKEFLNQNKYPHSFGSLRNDLIDIAFNLANLRNNNQLALFFGAGVSMNANLPSWNGLLKNLAISMGMTDENIENLNEFDILHQPTIIENRFRQKYGYEKGKKLFKNKLLIKLILIILH